MAQHRPGLRHQVYVGVGEPHTVGDRNLRSQEPKVVEVRQRSHPPVTRAIHLLVDRFLDVDVHAGLMFPGEFTHVPQHLVRAPVDVVRTYEHTNAVRLFATNQLFGKAQVVPRRHRAERKDLLNLRDEVRGQRAQEAVVVLVHQVVLVAVEQGKRHTHAGRLVGFYQAGCPVVQRHALREPPERVVVHHGRDAGLDHLHGAVERVQVRINVTLPELGDHPRLQRQVRRAKLERRQAAVVVGVDQPRDDDEVRGADNLVRPVSRLQIVVTADLDDLTVALEDGAVGDDLAFVVADGPAHDVLATDQRRGQRSTPGFPGSLAIGRQLITATPAQQRTPADVRPGRSDRGR